MATLQARFMLVAFVAMAAAITYNAAYLQSGPHPAPMARDKQTSVIRSAKSSRERRQLTKTLPSTRVKSTSLTHSDTIEAVQRKLAENGYEPGPVDGVRGQMTIAAIMAYQHDKGLPLTGMASAELLKHMILGTSVGSSAQSDTVPVSEEIKALVETVQKTLSELGYAPGPLDGVMGSATRTAIEKFERDRKLSVTGRISGRLVRELTQANGGRLSKLASR